jgi:type I restriction enzyme R subunit
MAVIREQEELLDELAGDEWWVDVTVPMLETARRRVRGLVRLLERRKRALIFTDFTDELGEVAEIELRGIPAGTDFARFREKARMYLRAHEDHVALQKLRRNRQLTASDMDELERMLADADLGDEADLDRARTEAHGLGLFVRSLIGLDRAAATDALAGFIDGRTLSANQLDFVTLVVDHLTQNGIMEAARLYESPFTDVAPQGPEGLFPEGDVDELLAAIDAVRASAQPTDEAA